MTSLQYVPLLLMEMNDILIENKSSIALRIKVPILEYHRVPFILITIFLKS